MRKVTVKVGFVPSYRFLYSPWCQKMRDDSLAAFAHVAGLEVVAPQPAPDGAGVDAGRGQTPHGMVSNLDEADAAADYFAACKVDALILCPLDFGDERSAAKIAERLQVPVLLYATREPSAPDEPGMGRVSDSYCGCLSMASALYRRKLPFHYAGIFFPDEPAFLEEVERFAAAVAVVAGLRGARIGQVGVRPATFETVGYDEAALIQKFHQNVVYAELADVVNTAEAYADDDRRVQRAMANLKASVAEVTVSEHHVVNAAKLEVALEDFWTRSRLSAMAVQCWPSIQSQMGISVCALYGRLTGRGLLTACEADVLGALAMLASYLSAMGRTVPHFIDWTIQHRENPNRLLAWHCGNAPSCLANNPEKTAVRSRKDMTGRLPIATRDPDAGLAQFQIRPGRVTFCRLAEYDNEWKMLIATGEIIPSDETLAGTWAWVEVKDHARLYRTLVEEGFVHHASMIHGDQAQALVLACKFLGIRPVLVE
jgi:L-fucose isomerase-like protein